MLHALDTADWRRVFALLGERDNDRSHPGTVYQCPGYGGEERPVSSRGFFREDVEAILALVSSDWPGDLPGRGMLLIGRLRDGRYAIVEATLVSPGTLGPGGRPVDDRVFVRVAREPGMIARRMLAASRLLLLARGEAVDSLDHEFQDVLEDAQMQVEIWRQGIQDGLEPR